MKKGTYTHTEETKRKGVETRMNNGSYKWTDEQKEKARKSHLGLIRSEEHCKNISISKKGKKRKPFSEGVRKKMSEGQTGRQKTISERLWQSERQKGAQSHFWKGGINPINLSIRGSLAYRLWREAVFARDNYTCVWCKQIGGKLNADHIKAFAYYPELRFVVNNGRTLCVPCHKTTDTYAGRSKKSFVEA